MSILSDAVGRRNILISRWLVIPAVMIDFHYQTGNGTGTQATAQAMPRMDVFNAMLQLLLTRQHIR